jgi:segregation and condensation protein B
MMSPETPQAEDRDAVGNASDISNDVSNDVSGDVSGGLSDDASSDTPNTTAAPAATPQARPTDRSMDQSLITRIVEAALLAANQPLTVVQLRALFTLDEPAPEGSIEQALTDLRNGSVERGVELAETASGYRFQVQADVHAWVARLWNERQTKYTRATLETLAIIAYRQPITRGEIEQVRGVAVSSNIIKALEEREWIRSVGHRDMPGRPELLGTTKTFLDYFGLKSLDQLPPLSELKDFGELDPQMSLSGADALDPDGAKAAALSEAMSIADAQAPIAAGIAMDEDAGEAANDANAQDTDTDTDTDTENDSNPDQHMDDDTTQDAQTTINDDADANEASTNEASAKEANTDDRDIDREHPDSNDDRSDDAAPAPTHDDSNPALVDDDDSTGA